MEERTESQPLCWKPVSILVCAGQGREPIDIVPYLVDSQDENAALMSSRKRVEFPASVYPPSWDNRKVIEDAVKNAVAESDNIKLVVYGTEPNVRNPRTTFACAMARPYRAPKNPDDPKRCTPYTEKLPRDQCCPFRIRLSLDPGKCWFLPPWSGCRSHKFHPKLLPGEKRRRVAVGEEGVTEGTTHAKPTQRCTGWFGEAHRSVIVWSVEAYMSNMKNRPGYLPEKFPLCGSFKDMPGYDQLEICNTIVADVKSRRLVARSKLCHLDFPRGKSPRTLCPSCGPLDERVKEIRMIANQSDSNQIR